jgi:hypothetical protein
MKLMNFSIYLIFAAEIGLYIKPVSELYVETLCVRRKEVSLHYSNLNIQHTIGKCSLRRASKSNKLKIQRKQNVSNSFGAGRIKAVILNKP